jgi:hypothetical protein
MHFKDHMSAEKDMVDDEAGLENISPASEESEEEVSVVTPSSDAATITVDEEESATVSADGSVSAKADEAKDTVKDLATKTAKKTKRLSDRGKEIAKNLASPSKLSAKMDAKDIAKLGGRVDNLAAVFEDTMIAISKQPYDEQVRILTGYNRLIQGQIDVINSRISWVSRVKGV